MTWILNLNCSIDDRWQLNVVRHCCLFELKSFVDFCWIIKFNNRYSIFFFKIEIFWNYSFRWFVTFVLRINDVIKIWNLLCKKTKKFENYNDRFIDKTRQDTLISIRWTILKILIMMLLLSKSRLINQLRRLK